MSIEASIAGEHLCLAGVRVVNDQKGEENNVPATIVSSSSIDFLSIFFKKIPRNLYLFKFTTIYIDDHDITVIKLHKTPQNCSAASVFFAVFATCRRVLN
jgi:hypothetical protein